MKKLLLVPAMLSALAISVSADAQDILTGDARLACEAILCLSSGTRPGECSPSLTRYFSIHLSTLSDTIKARANFLSLCPAATMNVQMKSLVDAIANGAGRCDAASLNATLITYQGEGQIYVSNAMPSYCSAYANNAYTNLSTALPKYVGSPSTGGGWVEAKDYAQALAAYNARVAADAATTQQQLPSGGY
jgi:hypothetical protein